MFKKVPSCKISYQTEKMPRNENKKKISPVNFQIFLYKLRFIDHLQNLFNLNSFSTGMYSKSLSTMKTNFPPIWSSVQGRLSRKKLRPVLTLSWSSALRNSKPHISQLSENGLLNAIVKSLYPSLVKINTELGIVQILCHHFSGMGGGGLQKYNNLGQFSGGFGSNEV